jgi:hypothetical protein
LKQVGDVRKIDHCLSELKTHKFENALNLFENFHRILNQWKFSYETNSEHPRIGKLFICKEEVKHRQIRLKTVFYFNKIIIFKCQGCRLNSCVEDCKFVAKVSLILVFDYKLKNLQYPVILMIFCSKSQWALLNWLNKNFKIWNYTTKS